MFWSLFTNLGNWLFASAYLFGFYITLLASTDRLLKRAGSNYIGENYAIERLDASNPDDKILEESLSPRSYL